MEIYKIYKDNELGGLNNGTPELQQKSQAIKSRFDQRRAFYHTGRNTISDFEIWSEVSDKITKFDQTQFNVWNAKWANILRNNNVAEYNTFFTEGNTIFSPLEGLYSKAQPQFISTDEAEKIRVDTLTKVEQDILQLKTDVLSQVTKGINNLLELKAELGLYQNFSENIKKELGANNSKRKWFLSGFIGSLCLISALLITSFFVEYIKSWDLATKISVKLAITIPLGFLSYFLFSQYKLYQIMSLKLSHLNGFLGGGATYLGQLTDQDPDAKRDTNKRLAQMFIELDDIMATVKQVKHPTQETMEGITKKIESLSSSFTEVLKTVKEFKGDK